MQSEIYHIILGAEITTTLANEQFKKVQMELDGKMIELHALGKITGN